LWEGADSDQIVRHHATYGHFSAEEEERWSDADDALWRALAACKRLVTPEGRR